MAGTDHTQTGLSGEGPGRTERELQKSRERLCWVLEKTGVGTWSHELPLARLNWDAQTKRLFFVPADVEPTVDLLWSRIHPEDRERVRLAVETALHEHTFYEAEYRIVNPDNGEVRWVHSAGQATYGDDAAPVRYDGVSYDITAHKRAEEERETTIEFLGLVNRSRGTKDLVQRATTFFQERSGCEAVGIRLREGEDFPYSEARGFPEEFVQLENKLCAKSKSGKIIRDDLGNPILECMCGSVICGRFEASQPFFTANGSFWTNSTTGLLTSSTESERQTKTRNRCNGEGYESVALIPLRVGEERFGLLQLNDRGKGRFSAEIIALWERLAGYLAAALSKFRADDALRDSERRYRAIGELIDYGVWVSGPDGHNTYNSESFLKLVGMTQQQCTDSSWAEMLHPDDVERTTKAWEECVRSGATFDIEHRYLGADGQWHPILLRGVPVRDDQGKIISWAGISLDISNRKKSEQALLRSEKLASAGRMAATIAHEINNPLEAVMNMLYLARSDERLSEAGRQYMEMAEAELKRIAHITRQSLGFYRESNASAPTSINGVLESAIDMLKSRIKAKRAVIRKHCDEDVEVIAMAGELRQVFSNLLANSLDAIEESGTIVMRVSSCAAFKDGERYVRVTVADNGKGIHAGSRQHLFEPFFTTKGAIGTGLGLWVSKQIVDKHGGSIRIRSCSDGERRGTVFSVVLPARPVISARAGCGGSLKGFT